ncbi:ABC transporter permease [Pseudomonas sp. 7P_10.2_Bac1]|uniref:ABC transporter permease n=1 Tax=Pseudomonas sp. 7P_10.2_Bac1 TaxID=2971614 RepID=UPI0021CA6264|nr:ABC transporter permease [Pseudomonas sp. 7P_10.2_Bac1]MCU1726860.1 ABC transporter permease [Pseudomonas sp. 7P_10.2_Bac1]
MLTSPLYQRLIRFVRMVVRGPLLRAVPTAAGVIVLNFMLLQMVPGDAVDALVAEAGSATAETTQLLRQQYGLDKSSLAQFGDYVGQLAHLSLGDSPRYGIPVLEVINQRLPNTLLLMGLALVISVGAGVTLGAVMALWAGKWPDRVLSSIVFVVYSTPGFWIGLMAIVLFAVKLDWLPAGGDGTIGAGLSGVDKFVDKLHYAILPALTLASFFVAIYARLTRASVLDVLTQDYVRTARAKGLSPWRITTRHVLRNALLPLTTVAGAHLGGLLGGAAVVETVFGWPGIGRLTLEAVQAREYKVLLGILLISSFIVIIANLLVDWLHMRLDPRIAARLKGG